MVDADRKVVSVSSRLAKFIGAKAPREKRLQAASMQAEFTLRDTLVILCYLGRDTDAEIASQARRNLIPAARNWFARPDRPDLPEPVFEIVMKVLDRIGLKGGAEVEPQEQRIVSGNVGLMGLGEIIQAVDHNNRTVQIMLERSGETASVFTRRGKVVGAVCGENDGLEALHRAFAWSDASFNYTHADPGDFTNLINVNTLTLVMDALEHAPDEDPFDGEQSWNWRVQGHLKTMNIFEIAEIFEMNSKEAICRLDREGGVGDLYFRNGRIVNASLGDKQGMDAACHLLAWPNAQFEIRRGGSEIPEVIHVGMQNLIIEAMRLLDEGVTVTDSIASELAIVNELFEGKDVVALPVLEKVRIIFAGDEQAREVLETDAHPVVRKALKVKISKTVHKYLNPATEHQLRLRAAQGKVPVSTSEKLVLLTYLSHDDTPEIREAAKKTLASLDIPTYRRGLGTDLHPSVMDFLVREMIRDESIINVVIACEHVFEETALHILQNWPRPEILKTALENKKLLERSPAVVDRLRELGSGNHTLTARIDSFEEAILQGQTEIKVEGPLSLCGVAGLLRAAKQGGRSGTIVIESPSRYGRVFFKRGRIIGAASSTHTGLPALEDILKWRDSRFRYVLRTHFHVENIEPTQAEDLLNSVAAMPSEGDLAATGMRILTGSLEVLDIFEALTSLEGTPQPVTLSFFAEEGSGEVYRDRSRILHAHVDGKESPEHAMAAMLSWSGNRFMVRQATHDFPVTVDRPLLEFLTEAMRLIPEEMTQAARPGELPEWELSEDEYESLYHKILQMGVAEKIKLALLGSKEARDILVRDPNKMVAVAVIKSPKIQESEVEAISKSKSVCDEVLRHIASSKEWTKSYVIKLNLASNSKTPIPLAMKFLTHLRELDLRKIAKSKDVSAGISTQARRLAEMKSTTG